MKRGFTLIELLAVIIVLAIIALIATPIVLDVIEDARESAIDSSLRGIVSAAEYYYAEQYLEQEFTGYECTFNNSTGCDRLGIGGKLPEKGNLTINEQGEVLFALIYNNTCYTKSYVSNEIRKSDNVDQCEVVIVNANQINYTSQYTTCTDVSCSLNELYEKLGGNIYEVN